MKKYFHFLLIIIFLALSGCTQKSKSEPEIVCDRGNSPWIILQSNGLIFDGVVFEDHIWMTTTSGLVRMSLDGTDIKIYEDYYCSFLNVSIFTLTTFNGQLVVASDENLAIMTSDEQWVSIPFEDNFPLEFVTDLLVVDRELWVAGKGGIVSFDSDFDWEYLHWSSEIPGGLVSALSKGFDGIHISIKDKSNRTEYYFLDVVYDQGVLSITDEAYGDYQITGEQEAYRLEEGLLFFTRDKGKTWLEISRLYYGSDYFVDPATSKVFYTDQNELYSLNALWPRKIIDLDNLAPAVFPINDITMDERGILYAVFESGLLIYDGFEAEIIEVVRWPFNRLGLGPFEVIEISSELIYTDKIVYDLEAREIVTKYNVHWPNTLVKGSPGHIYLIDKGNHLLEYQNGEMIKSIELTNIQQPYNVSESAVDHEGHYWFILSLPNSLLFQVVEVSDTEIIAHELPQDFHSNTKITFDGDNVLWAYDYLGHVYYLDSEGGWTNVSFDFIDEARIYKMIFDRNNDQWILSDNTLYLIQDGQLIHSIVLKETGRSYYDFLLRDDGLPCVFSYSGVIACLQYLD